MRTVTPTRVSRLARAPTKVRIQETKPLSARHRHTRAGTTDDPDEAEVTPSHIHPRPGTHPHNLPREDSPDSEALAGAASRRTSGPPTADHVKPARQLRVVRLDRCAVTRGVTEPAVIFTATFGLGVSASHAPRAYKVAKREMFLSPLVALIILLYA